MTRLLNPFRPEPAPSCGGAILTSLLWQANLRAFAWYASDLSRYTQIHGSIAGAPRRLHDAAPNANFDRAYEIQVVAPTSRLEKVLIVRGVRKSLGVTKETTRGGGEEQTATTALRAWPSI